MLREHAKSIEKIIVTVDILLVVASLVVADLVAGSYQVSALLRHYGFFLAVSSLVWFLLLSRAGFYRSLRTRGYADLVRKVCQTAMLAGVINAAALFVVAPRFSRRLYLLHMILAAAFLIAWKLSLRGAQRAVRRRGYNFRHLLVVGTRDPAVRFIRHVEGHRDWGFEIVGCVQGLKSPVLQECAGYPVLGRLDRLMEICKHRTIDEIIFTLPREYLSRIEETLPRLEAMGVTVRLSLDFYKPRQSRTMFGYLGEDQSVPVITYYRMSLNPMHLFLKRLLDVVGSTVGLAITAVLFPFVALAIKLDSPGPIGFRQKRVGRNGRIFTCFKFRTMYVDAEERKKELMARNEMSGAIFKIKDDPRITRVGSFLRKTSLDELPQFWNIFKGEMSLVGTRPPTPDEVEKYEEWHRGRISIKPGLTGMWQTSGRNLVNDFDKICHLDMSYIDNWSLWLDIKLLCKTVGMVAFGVGAR
jgi:exopolysaccharide biosynthesis polyprenyl glycosylphosphotransferase